MNLTFQVSKRFINRITESVTFKLQVGFQVKFDRTLLKAGQCILMVTHYRYLSIQRVIVKEQT